MADPVANFANVDLDHKTSVAVCNAIGERLRDTMKPAPLPSYFQELVDRMKEMDDAPSIVPPLGGQTR